MKTVSIALIALTSLTLGTTACKKKDEAATGGAKPSEGDKAGGGKVAPPAKLSYQKIGATGLEVEVAADATIDDTSASAGFPSATIYSSPTTFLSGAFSADDWGMIKATFEESKAGIIHDAGADKMKPFTKEEKTADGWQFEWEAAGMSGSPVYGIQIRMVVAGKAWDCGTNASSPAERETAIKVCKSVRKAS
jgi:hypothetical protein